jgi:hypothetical protein
LLLPTAAAKGHAEGFEAISVSSSDEDVAAALQINVGGLWQELLWGLGLQECSPALTEGGALNCLDLLHIVV